MCFHTLGDARRLISILAALNIAAHLLSAQAFAEEEGKQSSRPKEALRSLRDTDTLREVEQIADACFSSDGAWFAAGQETRIVVWNTSTWKFAYSIETRPTANNVHCLRFAPDGGLLAFNEGDDVIVWDIKKRRQKLRMEGHSHGIWGLAFSADSRFLASASWDQSAIIWDLSKGKKFRQFPHRENNMHNVGFVVGQRQLVTQSYNIALWNIESGKLVRYIDKDSYEGSPTNRAMAVSPTQPLVAASEGRVPKKRLVLFDLEKKTRTILSTGDRVFYCVSFSSNGERLAASSDEDITIWNIPKRSLVKTIPLDQVTECLGEGLILGAPWKSAISPNGKIIAAWTEIRAGIKIINVETGKPIDLPRE